MIGNLLGISRTAVVGCAGRTAMAGKIIRSMIGTPRAASSPLSVVFFSTQSSQSQQPPPPNDNIDNDMMPYIHHGKRPRFRDYKKFKSPRKRASKLMEEITTNAVEKSKLSRPKVWNTQFQVGDAIEIKMSDCTTAGGGSTKAYSRTEKVRGVVIGIYNKKLDTSILLRDVVFGQPIERRIPLHSPLLRSIKVLEKNFVFKGKRKVKRSKLYYLKDRNPLCKLYCFFFGI